MKIVCISDTHGFHNSLKLPEGDVIIHAGDVTQSGRENQVIDFLNWYTQLDYEYKIFIAGNHDYFFEQENEEEINKRIPQNITYLNDSGIDINGIKIWGSPIQPLFCNMAFNRRRGGEIKKHWDLIPNNTDVLVTHDPAYGVLDTTLQGQSVGCVELLQKVKTVQPQIHICGHIHEAYGERNLFGVDFVNASVVNFKYQVANTPIVFEVEKVTKSIL
ncbi:metallophosphatase domain-containing protein [Tenacibaculum sp. 190524A02b]|uniref:metallophosphatase domain-containing protein n=1 Tax=Tenacibaculum vairaonense TaxID=3137860 RepID=UPI0032B1CD6D